MTLFRQQFKQIEAVSLKLNGALKLNKCKPELQSARKGQLAFIARFLAYLGVLPFAAPPLFYLSHLHSVYISWFRRVFIFVIVTPYTDCYSGRSVNPPSPLVYSVHPLGLMNVHVFCVFIDWLSSHLSLTLGLNWGLNPLVARRIRLGAQWHSDSSAWGDGSDEGVGKPLAVALLIRLAKLRGESPHLAPFSLLCVFLEYM